MHLKAVLITVMGVLLMSMESLFIKLASIEASTFAFYVGILTFISINIILLSTKKKKIISAYNIGIKPLLITAFLSGISNIFFINAIKTTTVANTVMILASGPLFSALYGYLIYKEKTKKNTYVASFFIFIGLFIIFFSQLGSGDSLGNIYALLCVNVFSIVFVILSKHNQINRFAVTSIAGLVTAFASYLFVNNFQIDMRILYILLFVGLFITPISRVLLNIGTKYLPASEISILLSLETIVAPIVVWLVLKEVPAISTFVGGSVILLTLILNSWYVIRSK